MNPHHHIPLTITVSPAVHEALTRRGMACRVGASAIAQQIFDAALGMLRVLGTRDPLALPALPALPATPAAAAVEAAPTPTPEAAPAEIARLTAEAEASLETISEADMARGYSDAEARLVRTLKGLGSTEREIAKQTGISREAVRQILWGSP